jgi:hypothetical protein
MCGLFGGVSTYLSTSEIDIIKELGIISQFRGIHSTGIAFAYRGGKKGNNHVYSYSKEAVDSTGFLNHPNTIKIIKSLNRPMAFVGHCRAATIGEINKENAHPYLVDHILGAHNGTIHSLAPKKGEEGTDSLKLYKLIAEKGLDEALEEVKHGAYALTYFDTKARTLNLIRNEKRPLYLMKTDNGNTVYWASERAMLDFVAARTTTKFTKPTILEPNVLHTFNLGTIIETTRKIELKEDPPIPFVQRGSFPRNFGAPHFGTRMHEDDVLDDGWTPWSDDDEKKTTVQMGPVIDPTKPDTAKFGNYVDATEVDDKFTVPNSIDSAARVFPNQVKPFPLKIRGKNMLFKHLKYATYSQFLSVSEAVKLLNEGCLISKVRKSIYDEVLWLNDGEYIDAKFADDEFMKEYQAGKAMRRGRLVYVSLTMLNQSKGNVCH